MHLKNPAILLPAVTHSEPLGLGTLATAKRRKNIKEDSTGIPLVLVYCERHSKNILILWEKASCFKAVGRGKPPCGASSEDLSRILSPYPVTEAELVKLGLRLTTKLLTLQRQGISPLSTKTCLLFTSVSPGKPKIGMQREDQTALKTQSDDDWLQKEMKGLWGVMRANFCQK